MQNQETTAFDPAEGMADNEMLARMCKALGHPVRIQILRHLLEEDRCLCGRIVELLPLAQSTVSQHLKILKACGLVTGQVVGPRTCYWVDRIQMARMIEAMQGVFNPSGPE
jgi:DNA-binding transcriptional ArsR family regulator